MDERTAEILQGAPLTETEAYLLYETIQHHAYLHRCIEIEQGEHLLARLGWRV